MRRALESACACLLWLGSMLSCGAHAVDAPAVGAVGPGEPGPPTPVYACHETIATNEQLGIAASLDPYDPTQVRVDAQLTAPDGDVVVQPCFWQVPQQAWTQTAFSTEQKQDVPWERFRDYAAGRWCLRFSPDRRGAWSYRYAITQGTRTAVRAGGSFTAEPLLPAGSGPIALSKNRRAFVTADGSPYVPVGINCGWPTEAGSRVYAEWLARLSGAGGNATRLWLVHYYGGTSLEWSKSGVNDGYAGVGAYSQESAERVDRILAEAERRGVRVMLCLYTFGDTNWDWQLNPYARAAGGWLDHPRQFITDARARAATRALLRYQVARWGHSRALWAWEMWNEVETSEAFDDRAVLDWHREMCGEIKRLDAHHHLVTTDYRFTPPASACSAYALAQIDFVQLHTYWPLITEGFQVEIEHLQPFAKPVVIGEYGLHVGPESLAADPAGEHLHDGLWGGLFCGSVGGGMGWWWDVYVHPRDLYGHCTGLARFTAGESLDDLSPVPADTGEAGAPALALASDDRVWAWIRNARDVRVKGFQVVAYRVPALGVAKRVVVAGNRAGNWAVDVIDTYDGTWMSSTRATGTAEGLAIELPPYRHDVALKARRISAGQQADGASRMGPPDPTPWHERVSSQMPSTPTLPPAKQP